MYNADPKKLKRLREKWSKLLVGIPNAETRDTTAILLENQQEYSRENLRESTTSGDGFTPGVSTGDIDKFPKLVIPMVRRVMPQLIANEIFGVQPMEGPVGMAFSMRWVYDDSNSMVDLNTGVAHSTTAGDQAYVPGLDADLDHTYSGNSSATDAAELGYKNSEGEVLEDDDFSGDSTPTPNMKEGSLKIVNTTIEARTRKLKASWSQEAVDDIKKVHSMNLEQEMVDFLSYQIQAEIDRELIGVAYGLGTTNGLFEWDLAEADGRWQEEKYKTLYHAIIKVLNYVGHTTRRGRANWLIISSEVATMLSSIKAFDYSVVQPVAGFEPYEGGEGVVKMGTIENGKVTVYLDLYWQSPDAQEIGYIMAGFKGKKSYSSGILFCPYIPVMLLKTISPHTFHPLLSLGSRYAIVDDLLDTEKYYAVLTVKDTSIAQ